MFPYGLLWRSWLDLWAPLSCVVCGRPCAGGLRTDTVSRVRGLRSWDQVPLCGGCLGMDAVPRHVFLATAVGRLPVWAGAATDATLAGAVHAWKYQGQRGLVLPLAELVLRGAPADMVWSDRALVPVPLHGRRRRIRGFNQAAMLAELLAPRLGAAFCLDAVKRTRATGQQARLEEPEARRRNVERAFRASRQRGVTTRPRLVIVDDVVTSGATVAAVASALRDAGWLVDGVLAVATSLPAPAPVDTPGPGS